MIHLDRIKWAELSAETAVHADVDINVELFRLWNGTTCYRIVAAYNPDALRRAHLCADAAACTPILAWRGGVIGIINHKKWHEAEALWHRDLLFGVLHREKSN